MLLGAVVRPWCTGRHGAASRRRGGAAGWSHRAKGAALRYAHSSHSAPTFGAPEMVFFILLVLLCALAAPIAIPLILGFLGFTSGGVAAGSIAAMWQATFGGAVAANSFFAMCMSVGAAGLGLAGNVLAAIFGGLLAFLFGWFF